MTAHFNPTIDASIEGLYDPDNNQGASTVVNVGAYYIGSDKAFWFRAMFVFDVSSLGPVTVSTAELQLYASGSQGSAVGAKAIRIVRDIVEDEVTWNDASSGVPWTDAGAGHENDDRHLTDPASVSWTLPGATGEFEITGLGPHVQDAIDDESGIVRLQLYLDDEGPGVSTRVIIASKEHSYLPIPVLDVIHDGIDVPVPATATGRRGTIASSGRRGQSPFRPIAPVRPRSPLQPRRPLHP